MGTTGGFRGSCNRSQRRTPHRVALRISLCTATKRWLLALLLPVEQLLPPALPAKQPQRRLPASAEQGGQGHQHKTALQHSRVGQGELGG